MGVSHGSDEFIDWIFYYTTGKFYFATLNQQLMSEHACSEHHHMTGDNFTNIFPC